MTPEQERLLEEPVFRYFHQLCQVPRPSLREEQISAYLLRWAQARGLEAEQDTANNILIRKPASPGYEGAPCVMLQAHMDMVCEKAPEVEHDFDRDPILWQLEGDRITTGGRTTLGADDGIGMAFAMAVLTDGALPHPELEVLFTTAEEEDFSGASGFDGAKSRAARLINLDHASEREILCGSCGGMAAELTVPVDRQPVPDGWTAWELSVSGLKGGHSGEDIHRGRGSAVSLLVRVLLAFEERFSFALGPVSGGTFRLAIPRDARAVVCFPAGQEEAMKQVVRTLEQTMAQELSATGGGLSLAFQPGERPGWCSPAGPLITAALLAPDGIFQMNETLAGLVDTSDNLGELYLDAGQLRLVFEIRSAQPSLGHYLYQRMCRLAGLLGGRCQAGKEYPSWRFQPASELRARACRIYQEQFGRAPDCITVHAGLEVGVLTAKKPGLDAIAIGPDCWNFHSPSEQVSVSSVRKVYQFLCSLLADCRS